GIDPRDALEGMSLADQGGSEARGVRGRHPVGAGPRERSGASCGGPRHRRTRRFAARRAGVLAPVDRRARAAHRPRGCYTRRPTHTAPDRGNRTIHPRRALPAREVTLPDMASHLLIVESPSKAKTLKKYLGKDFEILASYGHVRD